MRKEAKAIPQVTLTSVASYHHRTDRTLNYAVDGYDEVRYFTSDRFERLLRDGCFFVRPNGKALLGFGLEIEMECQSVNDDRVLAEILNKIIFAHFPTGLYKLQADGSLGGESSAEAITQVMTKEFIRNHYADFKLMFDTYFPALGISAARSGNCGMHCNISLGVFGKTAAAQEEAVRKLFYIVNHHYEFCCSLFRRNIRHTHYCSRMTYTNVRTMNLHQFMSNHGVCFNLGHYDEGRIEIRLVGGQSNFASFRNTMESIFWLCSRVCKLSWADCDDLAAVFKGCNQYVFDRLTLARREGTLTEAIVEAVRPTVVRADYI